MSNKGASLRKFFLGGAAFGAMSLSMGAAWAQTPGQQAPAPTPPPSVEQTPAAEEEEARSGDRVVITGSRIARDQFTSSSPIVVVTAETSALQGQVDAADILQSQPIANGSTQINGQFGGFVVEGGPGVRTVALRGLGAQRTLVLLNGRRLGGAGTGGQVGAVDLNVLPASIVQRYEILKDGASSIYGSDAVAGVVNVITRNSVDRPTLNMTWNEPVDAGGTSYSIDGAYGLNFDNGSITFSGSWQHREELDVGDRDFLSCPQDYVFVNGLRTDIVNIRPGDPDGFKCRGLTQNVVQVLGSPVGGNGNNIVYVQDPVQVGLLPGLRPRLTTAGGNADIDTFHPQALRQDALSGANLYSLFTTADFNLGFADFYGELLLNRRESTVDGVSNIAPLIDQANPFNPYPTVAGTSTVGAARAFIFRPVTREQTVDYMSAVAGLKGDLPWGNWTWDAFASFTKSEGEYSATVVDARKYENRDNPLRDVRTFTNAQGQIVCQFISTGASCPVINYLNPRLLAGNYTPEEFDFIYDTDVGNTTYEQMLVSGVVTGDLLELPAGPLGVALGLEYRELSIDDLPGPITRGGFSFGSSAAGHTVGEDTIIEGFAEIEVPLIKGAPFIEELTVNASGRFFEYDSYGSDSVYKGGFNWQVTPLVRVRGTYGTSYRAPALYELFLANQTGFLAQVSIDPCINYGLSSDADLRTNCASLGIPDNYAGGGSGATIITGGGLGVLDPETSIAKTLGVILTPTQLDLSVALDYFEIEIEDEIARFGAASIAGACYGSPNFPNGFCDLLTRDLNPNSSTFRSITQVRDSYININNQRNSGLDLSVRYLHEFNFGDLTAEMNGTWTFDDVVDLFQGSGAFATNDYNGSISEPDFTAGSRVSLQRGDWTYSWFVDFVSRASNDELFGNLPRATYTDNSNVAQVVTLKRHAEATFYHDISVRYRNDDWSVTAGFNNLFDEPPPVISTSSGSTRLGMVPVFGTQYDLLGRTAFIQVGRTF